MEITLRYWSFVIAVLSLIAVVWLIILAGDRPNIISAVAVLSAASSGLFTYAMTGRKA